MPQETQTTETPQGAATTAAATATQTATAQTTETPGPIPYERFKAVNDKLAELTKWKDEQDQAAAKRKKDEDDAERKRLLEQNEHKTLAERAEARLKELEPLAERHTRLQETVQKFYEARLAELPAQAKTAVEKMPGSIEEKLAWMTENAALFAATKVAPPNLNQRDPGAIKGTLTEADIKTMKREEINARWDEISAVLDAKNKK